MKLPEESDLQWAAVRELVRRGFIEVLRSAAPVNEQGQFFEVEEERIIQNGLTRIAYVPRLQMADEKVLIIARRLRRVARKVRGTARMDNKGVAFLLTLAKRYQDLKGGYYILKRLRDMRQDEWEDRKLKADENDVEVRRACEIACLGIPESISDFTMDCRYELVRANGKRERLVVIQSEHGRRTGLISLPSEPFAQSSKFREWLLDAGNFTWEAGERELNRLQMDVAYQTANLQVREVTIRGYDEDTKLWFFEDCAFTPEGKMLRPDANRILWHDGLGYWLGAGDHEGQDFCQRPPRMHPIRRLGEEEAP